MRVEGDVAFLPSVGIADGWLELVGPGGCLDKTK